jgi:transcriptional repressor NF-X1
LAEALGISSDKTERNKATYRDELIAFARANSKFIPVVEKSLAEYVVHPRLSSHGYLLMRVSLSFVQSDKKTLVLPKMPPDRRKFIQEVNPP